MDERSHGHFVREVAGRSAASSHCDDGGQIAAEDSAAEPDVEAPVAAVAAATSHRFLLLLADAVIASATAAPSAKERTQDAVTDWR